MLGLNFGEQMGNPSVAPVYYLVAVACCLGTLQIIAARYGYIGLGWVRPNWQPLGGYILGGVFIVGSIAAFFATQSDAIFRPGPAGFELFVLFGLACCVAIPLTLVLATVIQSGAARRTPPRRNGVVGERVTLPLGPGWLYRPQTGSGRRAAVCAIGTPGGGPEAAVPLASALAEAGLVALAVGWDDVDGWHPDEADAIAAAISGAAFLAARDDVDASRLGTAGVGLGGDVALQVAAHDHRIRAVVAVAPWIDLTNASPGLSLLREMTLPQALRWQRALHQAARQLDPLAYANTLDGRPILLVAPADTPPSEPARRRLAAVCRRLTTLWVPRLGQSRTATQLIAGWMTEQLAWIPSSSAR